MFLRVKVFHSFLDFSRRKPCIHSQVSLRDCHRFLGFSEQKSFIYSYVSPREILSFILRFFNEKISHSFLGFSERKYFQRENLFIHSLVSQREENLSFILRFFQEKPFSHSFIFSVCYFNKIVLGGGGGEEEEEISSPAP